MLHCAAMFRLVVDAEFVRVELETKLYCTAFKQCDNVFMLWMRFKAKLKFISAHFYINITFDLSLNRPFGSLKLDADQRGGSQARADR